MVDEEVDLCDENRGEWRVQHAKRMAEEVFRHGKGEPAGLVDEVEQKVQKKQTQREPHQAVLYGLAGGRTQDEICCAIEELKDAVHLFAASPLQISQAASAWCCNIERPPNVLAPKEEASERNFVSAGL